MSDFESERLSYNAITEEDTDDILRWRNSSDIKKYFLYRSDISREDHLAWVRDRVNTGSASQFIISETATGRRIGSVYIRDIDHAGHQGEYGIYIGETDCQGLGYGTECAKAMIDYAFKKLGLNRIFLRVIDDNKKAIRSYEKAGFVTIPEGTEQVITDNEAVTVRFMEICKEAAE